MPLFCRIGGISGSNLSANAAMYEIAGTLGSKLSANGPVCKIGGISGSKLSANAAVYESGTLLVAHYCMFSANIAITDIDKTSMSLLMP